VARGDELQIRSPMLVGQDGRCMSIVRHITEVGSDYLLAVASTPASMQRDERELALSVTEGELKDVLAVLRGASATVRLP